NSGSSELSSLARLARSMNVTVVMFTQRVTDVSDAGLDEDLASGMVLMLNKSQARIACKILGVEPTAERISRIIAPCESGEVVSDEERTPIWDSLKPLFAPGTREVWRGSVAIVKDLRGRVVPVEVRIPDWFFPLASTNKLDMDAREEAAS